MKQIRESTTVPILTGEDIFLKEPFMKLIEMGAVDMIHPDLASSGGLIETKKIGDYAMEHGVAMAMHFAGHAGLVHGQRPHAPPRPRTSSPSSTIRSTSRGGRALVRTADGKPLVEKGFAIVPDSPGLGVEVNVETVKQHLRPNSTLFAPTPEWDTIRSNDRPWS